MNTKVKSRKNLVMSAKNAFTLAEVLITLGIVGVVAAVTLPALITNIQERVRKEQVRTVKYKLTKATDKMNSLGLIGSYGGDDNVTERFVTELQKHMSISKICKSNELDKCWASESIYAYTGGGTTLSKLSPNYISTGEHLKALALSTKQTKTVGIVTGDGVPMLLVYSPVCSGFDEAKTYTWSVEDGKPVTNATTNCISAIFDINGAKGPNRIGQDVRTLNSLFGAVDLGSSFEPAGVEICSTMKRKYGVKYCNGTHTINNKDYWIGAMYACDKLALHLPGLQTLASVANSRYGVSIIGPYTVFLSERFGDCIAWASKNCEYWLSEADNIICHAKTDTDLNSSIGEIIDGNYWSNQEFFELGAYYRNIRSTHSNWFKGPSNRNWSGSGFKALCVGD